MTEFHAGWFAAMFAANSELDVRPRLATEFARDAHQFANAGLVDRGKRILFHDFIFLVSREERAGIIAAHAQRRLRQIIRAETEELSVLGDFIRDECGARNFDHRPNEIIEFRFLFLRDFCRDAMNHFEL